MGAAEEIREGQDKGGMLLRSLERLVELYTDKVHFIYELIQNAEDAQATKISFEQQRDRLIVRHDGRPFTKLNANGICDIAKSDKTDDLNQIGEFGVGFKSVFCICDKVSIYSARQGSDGFGPFAIEITGFVDPEDIENPDYESVVGSGYTTAFVLPFCVSKSFSSFNDMEALRAKLAGKLQNLGVETMLFLKNIEEISYSIHREEDIDATGTYLCDSREINGHCHLVSSLGDTQDSQEEISYLVFSRPVESCYLRRTIDIAFKVRQTEDNGYAFIDAESPYVSVFFPTETPSNLSFLIQGPFRMTPNRSSIPMDDEDNERIASAVAELFRDSMLEMRDRGEVTYELLNLLPRRSGGYRISSNKISEGILRATEQLLRSESILPARDGSYVDAPHARIARSEEMVRILPDDLLTELVGSGERVRWLSNKLSQTNREYAKLREAMVDAGVEVLVMGSFKGLLADNPDFLPSMDDDWLKSFYAALSNVKDEFNVKNARSNLCTSSIIKTSRGAFVAPCMKIGDSFSLNVYIPGATILPNLNYVNENLLRDCREFFEETLHLKEPDTFDTFMEEARTRHALSEIDPDIVAEDAASLVRSLGLHGDEVKAFAVNCLRFVCYDESGDRYLSEAGALPMLPVSRDGCALREYFRGIAEKDFVDVDLYERHGVTANDLVELGVSENILTGEDAQAGKLFHLRYIPRWSTEGTFRWKLSIEHLAEALDCITLNPDAADSKAKSQVILHTVLSLDPSTLTGRVSVSGTVTPDVEKAYSRLIDILRSRKDETRDASWEEHLWSGKWLYDENMNLVSQSEISKFQLNKHIYGRPDVKSKIYELLGFREAEDEATQNAIETLSRLDPQNLSRTLLELLENVPEETARVIQFALNENRAALKNASMQNAGFAPWSDPRDDAFTFPAYPVKNWDRLRQHVAESLCFARPVEYAERIRRVRITKGSVQPGSYLDGFYEENGLYACQMCHGQSRHREAVQICAENKFELEQLHLNLCNNCAVKYRAIRADGSSETEFVESIKGLDESDIDSCADGVRIPAGSEEIWFAQTHAAEASELLKLLDAVEGTAEKYR